MSVRTMLLPLRESETSAELLASGVAAARRLKAYLTVLHVRPRADVVIPFATLGLSASMKASVIESTERGASEVAERLRAQFEEAISNAGVAERKLRDAPGEAGAQWLEVAGRRDVMSARYGRLADLIVVPRPSRIAPVPATFEAALRDTGRPVMMVPRGERCAMQGRRIVIAWNGSAAASKALAAALPMLETAQSVTVLTTAKRANRIPTADGVVDYLACHGVKASTLVMETKGQDVGKALLDACRAADTDLLVAGGYSRSRFSEIALGGVTRYLMEKSDRPTLLCH